MKKWKVTLPVLRTLEYPVSVEAENGVQAYKKALQSFVKKEGEYDETNSVDSLDIGVATYNAKAELINVPEGVIIEEI